MGLLKPGNVGASRLGGACSSPSHRPSSSRPPSLKQRMSPRTARSPRARRAPRGGAPHRRRDRDAPDRATDVRTADAFAKAAHGALKREKGAFDPVLFADVNVNDQDTPTASPFSGADVLSTTEKNVAAGARLRLPIGTELSAILETSRLETNSAFASFNPQHTTGGRLVLRQPLLAGFGPSANVGRSTASSDLEAARARATDTALAVAADVEATYWDLHAAELDLAVRRLRAAWRGLVSQATQRTEAGLAGPGNSPAAYVPRSRRSRPSKATSVDAISDQLATLLGPGRRGTVRTTSLPPADFRWRPRRCSSSGRSRRTMSFARRMRIWPPRRARARRRGILPRLDVWAPSAKRSHRLGPLCHLHRHDVHDPVHGRLLRELRSGRERGLPHVEPRHEPRGSGRAGAASGSEGSQ